MNKAQMAKTLDKMIDEIEEQAIALQMEMDEYESAFEEYEAELEENEDAIEPDPVDHQDEIEELDTIVDHLRKAKDLLDE